MKGPPDTTGVLSSLGPPRWPAAVGAGTVLACAAWAFWPLDRSTIEAPNITMAERNTDPRIIERLDLAAFRAPLWVAPPEPPAPVAAGPPPPPLKLQLIAILNEDGEYRAALYDPDADTLTVVGPGDAIAGRKVERVGRSEVVVLDGNLVRTLALHNEAGRP